VADGLTGSGSTTGSGSGSGSGSRSGSGSDSERLLSQALRAQAAGAPTGPVRFAPPQARPDRA
jgi:hypothetical protein